VVVEEGNISGTQKKGNVPCWNPLQSNDSEDVTVDISMYALVNYKVQSCAVCIKESDKSDHQSKTPILSLESLDSMYVLKISCEIK
jgi:hypothetical protein